MPRKSSGKAPLRFWLTATQDGKDKPYIQVAKSMARDKRVQALAATTWRVYEYCAQEAGQNETFKFTAAKAKQDYGVPHGTFQRAIKELREAGFIEIIASGKNLSGPTEYRFSKAWKERPPP